MRTWHFVRHGESTANQEGWLAGQQDVKLTPAGRAQAKTLAMLLAAQDGLPLGALWSSDLIRAADTATLIHSTPNALRFSRDVFPRQSEHFRERHAGAWTKLLRDKLPRSEMDKLRGWDFAPPEGESMAMMAARVIPQLRGIEAAMNRIAADDAAANTDVLIVSHGGLMRVMIGLLDGVPKDQIGSLGYSNCELVSRDTPRDVWAEMDG